MNREQREQVADMVRQSQSLITQRAVVDFKEALGLGKSVRLRYAEVTALSATESTCSVKFSGSSATVAGIPYFTCLPCPTVGVWIATDGEDAFVISSQGPAPTVILGRTTDTANFTTSVFDTIAWHAPMDGNGNPQNNATDYWGSWASGNASRFTFPAPGVWDFRCSVQWEANASGRRIIEIRRENDAVVGRADNTAIASGGTALNAVATIRIASVTNTYVQVHGWQSSGGNLAIDGDTSASPVFTATWRGPASPVGTVPT